jgi:hypothetical protein
MEPTGSTLGASSAGMALDSERSTTVTVHGECFASQGLRAEPGVLPTEPNTICPSEADAQVLRRV